MTTPWRRLSSAISSRLRPEVRLIYGIQLLLLFAISTLLYIGFPSTREWRRLAVESGSFHLIHGWDGLSWYVWLAAAPLMMLQIRNYPLVSGRVVENLARINLASLLLYLLVTHVRYFLRLLPEIDQGTGWGASLDLDTYAFNIFGVMPLDFLTYWGFFGISFSIDYYFKNRANIDSAHRLQLRTARLQSDLAHAELAALRSQLHPHFLFNSFNALATLVRQRKNDAAVEIIAQLSALLRLAIDRSGLEQIPLHQELDFIRRYLEIEQVRFGEKLRVELAMDPATTEALVPNIVLQPLVENAVKHGISLRTSPGRLRVTTKRAGERLLIEIQDDGPDAPPPPAAPRGAKRPGIGLANARTQLDKTYGSDYTLNIAKQPAGGTVVTLDLPFHAAPPAP